MTEQLKISASEATPGDKSEFPGMFTEDGTPWHYLDSAATAQKPQIVLDSVAWALGEGYATVHRGVYSRSARMTMGVSCRARSAAKYPARSAMALSLMPFRNSSLPSLMNSTLLAMSRV